MHQWLFFSLPQLIRLGMAIRTASNKHRTACSTSGFRDLSCAEGFNNSLWWPWTLQSICYRSSKLNMCQISPKASCSFHSSSSMLHNGRRKLLVSVLRKPGALVKTDVFFFFLQLILKYFVLKELVLAVV